MRNEELVDLSVPRLIESDPFTPNITETVRASAVGSFTALDVWLKYPASWADDVEFRVYGRVGDARVLLKTVTLGDALKTTSGETSAILVSVRGWSVNSFEVSTRDPRVLSTGSGRLLLQVWHHHTPPGIVGGPAGPLPIQTPFGGVLTVQPHPAGPAFVSRPLRDAPRYTFTSSAVAKPPVTAAGSNGLLSLRVQTKRVEIQRIEVRYWGTSTSEARLLISKSTSAATGGVALTGRKLDEVDPNISTLGAGFAVGNAPTVASPFDVLSHALRCNETGVFVFDADAWGKPLVLRASTNDSLLVRLVVDTAVAGGFTNLVVNVLFTEI